MDHEAELIRRIFHRINYLEQEIMRLSRENAMMSVEIANLKVIVGQSRSSDRKEKKSDIIKLGIAAFLIAYVIWLLSPGFFTAIAPLARGQSTP